MYNPVLNSSLLNPMTDEEVGSFNFRFKNTALKIGAITKVHETDEETNWNKLLPEYEVTCVEQDENRGISTTIYKNCLSIDTFGSIADYVHFKRRTPKNTDFKTKANPEQQDSNMVLVLCIDGNSDRAIIIGGISHPSSKAFLDKAKEIHFQSEYNGLNIQIDKDGAFTVNFKGATENDGTQKDKDLNTLFKIEKDGSIELNDNKGQSFRMDRTNNTIDLKSEKDQNVTTNANFNLTSKENTSMSMKDLIIRSSGSAMIDIDKSINLNVTANASINAKSLNLVVDSIFGLKGQTINIEGKVFLGGKGGTPAVTQATQFLGTGNLGSPVVSTAIGPFSSKVFIAQ